MQKFSFFLVFVAFIFGLFFMALPAHAEIKERIPLKNPIAKKNQTDSKNIEGFIETRLSDLLSTMFGLLGVISLFPVVIGGIQLIISRGTASMAEKGKKTLYWGFVGLVVGLLGVIIFNFLLTSLIQTT